MRQSYTVWAPTNIAFLKYWGKRSQEKQWPANNSLSMTLADWNTRCRVRVTPGSADHEILYSGKKLARSESFAKKAFRQLDRIAAATAASDALQIETDNSFPTGCGVASSASSMAALTIAAVCAALDCDSFDSLAKKGWDRLRLADLARQGSGSACRSLWGGFVMWQTGPGWDQQKVAQVFSEKHWELTDTLVVVSDGPKKVSSTEAHQHAWSSPLFGPRVSGIPEKESAMLQALERRSLRELGPLLETEALEMHSVMMTASPASCYLSEESTGFLTAFREFRRQAGLELYFTIDAGPNIHIIGEQESQKVLQKFLARDFSHLRWMSDRVGAGPRIVAGDGGVCE